MRLNRVLIIALLAGMLFLVQSASSITVSVSNDVGGFIDVIDAGFNDRISGSTTIGSDRLSNSVKGSGGSFKESHSVSNNAGAKAEVGINISQAEWYSYSFDLWPGQGSNWKANKYPQVAASEDLDVLNASYIEAYADASSSKGHSAGVSTVISDPENEASLMGYSNLAMASKNEAFASQTADWAFSPNGYIQAETSADFTQMKSKPLRFKEDKAETSIQVDSESIEGYSDLATASALGVTASQQIDAAIGEQIQTGSLASSKNASLFQGLKAERAKVNTRIEGSLTGYNASARSFDGSVQVDQTGQIIGSFTSTALAGSASKTRSSNYGDIYDFDMQARKNASGSYASGTLGYYVDNVSPTANRIQGAVDASESGDAINVAPGMYFENVRIGKSLDIKGAGAGETIVDGQQSGSVFVIGKDDPQADVALSGMTIQGGSGSPIEFYPGYIVSFGGGILNYGTLKLKGIIISGNTANHGGGVANLNAILSLNGDNAIINNEGIYEGGGIYSYDNSTVNLNDNSYISNNYAGLGGGIFNDGYSSVNLNDNSRIRDNSAYRGGGISNEELGIVSLNDNSCISNNSAHEGGGIYNIESGIVSLNDNSCISDNFAEIGGGVSNGLGGSTLNLNDRSHISKNTAYKGGGVYNARSIVNLNDNGRIIENSAISGGGVYNRIFSTVNLNNDGYVGNNSAEDGGGVYNLANSIVNLNDNGSVSNNTANIGGGIFSYLNSTVNLNDDSGISGNKVFWVGGGIYSEDSMVNMNDNGSISNNSAEFGGGISAGGYGNVSLNDNSSVSNNSAIVGGGISSGGYVTVSLNDNSCISDNIASYYGGGVSNGWYNILNLNDRSHISNNIASDYGGGISNQFYGTVNLNNDSYIDNNSATTGGGIFNDWQSTVNLNGNSQLRGNTARHYGGAIYSGGILTIANVSPTLGSLISHNSAVYGGAIYNTGILTIANVSPSLGSLISYNSAVYGGAIYNTGTLTIANISPSLGSTISNNNAELGGGIYNERGTVNMAGGNITGNNADYGGGIFNYYGSTVNLFGGNITGNNADYNGGGIYNNYGIIEGNKDLVKYNYPNDIYLGGP